jgi:hypothetical protein
MKYFEVEKDGKDILFTRITSLRAFLKDNPEITGAYRYWWSGSDLVECEHYTREEIMATKARKLKEGMTAQWAQDHGRLR